MIWVSNLSLMLCYANYVIQFVYVRHNFVLPIMFLLLMHMTLQLRVSFFPPLALKDKNYNYTDKAYLC